MFVCVCALLHSCGAKDGASRSGVRDGVGHASESRDAGGDWPQPQVERVSTMHEASSRGRPPATGPEPALKLNVKALPLLPVLVGTC